MKKYFYVGIVCIVALLIFVFVVREKSIISIKPNEVANVEIYNSATNNSEVQVMNIIKQQDVAELLNSLRRIKPNDNAKPLDGNYSIIFNKTDGTRLIYVYDNGMVKTSTGFKGRVKSDNIINRLWAKLEYPVQNVTRQ
ncbi:hypothetical protein MUG84_15860 [Paenibacillus sp. KQZ6P-2]|uniref:Uncharacterized protein n=1 Tax=Paenibacillus mangrovi TaxID=2931978 RepID=A0A9X1WQJ0_9BACL|nr:hypothetical protein [Paenibacillus mangrovi]MCJ8013208.1 hypothetical protein [Paenibacillus mangrovi]